jgi:putative CocE/NonD family hydrolase
VLRARIEAAPSSTNVAQPAKRGLGCAQPGEERGINIQPQTWHTRHGDRAGTVHTHKIDLWNTCQTFRKDHCIRVEVSSSAFPKYDRNPNTGEPLGKTARMQTADQKIYHDQEHPSFILLPIVPPKATSAVDQP